MPNATVRRALSGHWFDRFARAGYAAKGVVFGIVGGMAAHLALGARDEQADFGGAFETMGSDPLSQLLLGILAAGLAGYALWRIALGALDVEGHGSEAAGLARRASFVVVGLMYGFFSLYAVWILAGRGGGGDDEQIHDLTAFVLELPLGPWLVGAAGAIILVMGLAELYFASSGRFRSEFAHSQLGGFERFCLLCTGAYGHAARGIISCVIGFFTVRAAAEYDPDEARGLAEAFRELVTQPFGPWIVAFVAAGFISFGLYCVLLAFHRHIPNEDLIGGAGRDRS
jgi:hypothetical protein